jgi:molybdopterin synthase sulfur carrier subunit
MTLRVVIPRHLYISWDIVSEEEMSAMEVTVRYFTLLRNLTGKREEQLSAKEDCTIEDILGLLSKKYGSEFEEYVHSGRERRGLRVLFFLDGRNIEGLDGLKTKLRAGSVLALMPPVAGG